MKPEHIGAILASICAIATVLQTWQMVENRKLRRKLRQAIKDCIAFYQLEELYCRQISEDSTEAKVANPSALSVKRVIRARLRGNGMDSPSSDATPQRLVEELRKLK